MNLTYQNVIQKAFEVLPEFYAEDQICRAEGLLYADSGVHIVFCYAFVPVLLRAFHEDNEPLIKRMFAFMEEMVKSPDKEVGAVCDFSILEAINDEIPAEKLNAYMGPETKLDLDYMRVKIGYLE